MHNLMKVNRLTILHIDDDPIDAILIRENLLSGIENVDIVHLSQPAMAADYYQTFDAVMLDYDMKSMLTGIELASMIKSQYPEIPIIIITGMEKDDDRVAEITAHHLFIGFKNEPLQLKMAFRQLITLCWAKPNRDRRSVPRL